MIKTYSLYEAATGLFTGKRLQCDEDALLEGAPAAWHAHAAKARSTT
jgi:hypothetical protein